MRFRLSAWPNLFLANSPKTARREYILALCDAEWPCVLIGNTSKRMVSGRNFRPEVLFSSSRRCRASHDCRMSSLLLLDNTPSGSLCGYGSPFSCKLAMRRTCCGVVVSGRANSERGACGGPYVGALQRAARGASCAPQACSRSLVHLFDNVLNTDLRPSPELCEMCKGADYWKVCPPPRATGQVAAALRRRDGRGSSLVGCPGGQLEARLNRKSVARARPEIRSLWADSEIC